MSKTKVSGAKHYEILFIMPNKFTDDEAKKIAEKVGQVITENGGQITYSEYWGKKKLAYEIKHNAYGYYALFEFDLEGNLLAKIDQNLRLSTEVLRHQVVVKKTKSAEELKKAEIIRAKIDSKKAAEEKEKIAQEKKSSTTTSTSPATKTKDDRVDLKDLDKKLEGILNADDLI
jgi:small subunit ribosomal protein S6